MAEYEKVQEQQPYGLKLIFFGVFYLLLIGFIFLLLYEFSSTAILIVSLLFVILLIFPLLPGLVELYQANDSEPLKINMIYMKDPLYFSKSLLTMIKKSVKQIDSSVGIKRIKLSKMENVIIFNSLEIPPIKRSENILFIKDNFKSGRDVKLNKEVIVGGNAIIGKDNILRALYCDNDVSLLNGTKVTRWVNSKGNIKVFKGCNLGKNAACKGKLEIEKGCKFKSLFGNPITTFNGDDDFVEEGIEYPEKVKIYSGLEWRVINKHLSINTNNGERDGEYNKRDVRESILGTKSSVYNKLIIKTRYIMIPASSTFDKNFVVKKTLNVGANAIIIGSIKAYKDIYIENNVIVHGNIFAEGDITIGEGSVILGDIFSQNRVILANRTIVGRPNGIKSIVGKKMVQLGEHNVVHGYVLTEGSGVIV